MNINKMKELVEKELFKRKNIEVLEVDNEIYKHYKTYIKNNQNEALWTCRKKLTIKYILGTEIRRHTDGSTIRAYGNLKIKVKDGVVIGIINNKGIATGYINEREKMELDRIYLIKKVS